MVKKKKFNDALMAQFQLYHAQFCVNMAEARILSESFYVSCELSLYFIIFLFLFQY
jgi:hypothetical protein